MHSNMPNAVRLLLLNKSSYNNDNSNIFPASALLEINIPGRTDMNERKAHYLNLLLKHIFLKLLVRSL
jgi:hypothetical protein